MEQERWQRVKSLFAATLERPAAERAAFLKAHADDADMRARVEQLLDAHADASQFLAKPAVGVSPDGPPAVPLERGTQLGAYEILSPLGAGAMGEVYRARDTRLHRDVALKVLPAALAQMPDRLARFRREATSAAALSHPNICTIHEIGEAAGHPFIAMELVEGETLADRVKRAPLTVDELLTIGVQLADALDTAGRQRIVHRDLKPANIVVGPRGRVKILDFGLAKQIPALTNETMTHSALTEAGLLVGTLAYMSPEQARGHAVDHRSDLFSLGSVLYELLTGRQPFSGSSAADLLHAIVQQTPAAIPRFNPEVPDALVRVVMKLLEKNPDDRYQSAHEVWVDLRKITAERSRVVVAAAPVVVPQSASTRLRWIVAAMSLVIAVGVVAWWAIARNHPTAAAPAAANAWTRLASSRSCHSTAFPTTRRGATSPTG